MKKSIPVIGISIISGVLISWLEKALSFSNLNSFNAVNIKLSFFLISLLAVLLIVYLSSNLFNAILSIVLYEGSFIMMRLYVGDSFGYELYVRFTITVLSALIVAVFLYAGKTMLNRNINKAKSKANIAFPLIFFFASVLFAATVILLEQNVILFGIPRIFYSYLYFLIVGSILFAFLSFNEISGFLIGFFSISVYFLMMTLIKSNFDFRSFVFLEREFGILIVFYSLILAFSTALIGGSSRVFVRGLVCSRNFIVSKKAEKSIKKEKLEAKGKDKLEMPAVKRQHVEDKEKAVDNNLKFLAKQKRDEDGSLGEPSKGKLHPASNLGENSEDKKHTKQK